MRTTGTAPPPQRSADFRAFTPAPPDIGPPPELMADFSRM